MPEINLMQRAIEEAEKGKTPFGAVLFNGSRMIVASNTGRKEGKIHHAELNALLKMRGDFKGNEPLELFTTCEPCPMCTGASIWAGVDRIYFGVSIEQASQYLSQIHVTCFQIAEKSFHQPEIFKGRMIDECLQLFEKYA